MKRFWIVECDGDDHEAEYGVDNLTIYPGSWKRVEVIARLAKDGWELNGKIRICPDCILVREDARPCPSCGHQLGDHIDDGTGGSNMKKLEVSYYCTGWSSPNPCTGCDCTRSPKAPLPEPAEPCQTCGSLSASFGPDPYNSDVNDDDTPVWLCGECRHESAMDV